MFGLFRREKRESIENPLIPISDARIASYFGLDALSETGEPVTVDSAMGVPAIWASVNVIPGAIAQLPLHVFRRGDAGRERVETPIASILGTAPNPETTSFQWRKSLMQQVLTHGRGVAFIERDRGNRVRGIWGLDPTHLTVKRENGRKLYIYRDGHREPVVYSASDVIDIPFALRPDGLRHYSPIMQNADVVGLAIALTKYGARYFSGGGVPPFAVTGNFQSGAAMDRARDDLERAMRQAVKEKRQALTLPEGLTISSIGADAERSQMVEAQRFVVEQIARIYGLSPIFLQDLTHGTFSNTEQQDLHFVKHTLSQWIEQIEQELNLKLFGSSSFYAEFNLDGVLRGDFKTRMEGYASAIQHGVLLPNEARAMENREAVEGGDRAYMQGAMLPIDKLGEEPANDDI